MQNMEAVLAGIRVQKDRAMKDLSYARKEGNPTKIEEFQKKVALIDAQIKEIQEQFPKFKEEKKSDPGRKVNFSDVDAQLAELKNFGSGLKYETNKNGISYPVLEVDESDSSVSNASTAGVMAASAAAGAAGAAGLYGLYKLYRHLKNKKNRTPEEEQQMQEAKGKLDAASKK